jgi:hypothetical protein
VRTEIVYSRGKDRYRRATVISLAHAQREAKPLGERGPYLPEPATFEPAHTKPRAQVTYLDFNQPGNIFKRWEPARKIPARVIIGSDRYPFNDGPYSARLVHVITPEDVHALEVLDEQISVLEALRREMIEEAYTRGRPIRPADIVEATKRYEEERDRLREKKTSFEGDD